MNAWYWLSFADGELPPGSQFLGACIVSASDEIAAVRKSHTLGINPGGEVLIYPLTSYVPHSDVIDRLFSKSEATDLSKRSDWLDRIQ